MKISLKELRSMMREEIIVSESIQSAIDLHAPVPRGEQLDVYLDTEGNTALYDLSPPTDSNPDSLNPTFYGYYYAIFEKLKDLGYSPEIVTAYRSPRDQIAAIQGGSSQVEDPLHSKHVSLRGSTAKIGTPNAYAVDIRDGANTSPAEGSSEWTLRNEFYSALGQIISNNYSSDITWGGSWREKGTFSPAFNLAWDSNNPMGWDPGHFEYNVDVNRMKKNTLAGLESLEPEST